MTTPRAAHLEAIGQLLQKHRKAANLTQEELGVKAELTREHISRIESGKTDLAVSTLARLEAALGLQPGFLMSGESAGVASGAA